MVISLVVAVLVSVVLDRQERRHSFEKSWEYRRLGIPFPMPKPKLSRLVAWLNVQLGLLVVLISIFAGYSQFLLHQVVQNVPGQSHPLTIQIVDSIAFALAGGVALIILGLKAVKQNSDFERGFSGDKQGIGEAGQTDPTK